MAETIEKIQAELLNIELVVREIEELKSVDNLDKYQINSAALYLHNFYNGTENIFKQLCKHFNIAVPNTESFHKDLLKKIYDEKFITEDLYNELCKYLGFRHFISHNYFLKLDINIFYPLVVNLPKVYNKFRQAILKEFPGI